VPLLENLDAPSWLASLPTRRSGPGFKAWFGQSCVRDRSGPLVVYHGTDAQFDRFDFNRKLGNKDEGGPFFTDSEVTAHDYGSRLLQAYVAIERPYIVSYASWLRLKDPSIEVLRARGHDGFKIEEFNSGGRDGDVDGESSDISTVYVPFVSPDQILILPD
jgi:hypothetical protein